MFIVCGEALFDVFALSDTPHGIAFDGRIGGSPLNVAVGLSRLGQPVAFLGGIGSGFAGQRLMRALADEGIDTCCVARTEAPTTLSLVGLDAQGVPSYAFYGHGSADRQLRPEHLTTIPDGARAIHVGSYSMVIEPVGSTLRGLVEREHRRRVIAYDPNLRLNVEPDLQRWRETVDWMRPRTHLLKLSEEDLSLLAPEVPADDWARSALDAGALWVVITHGAQGATSYTRHHRIDAAPQPVTVMDTVGAGDTFQASLLAWLAEHDALSPAAIASLEAPALRAALQFACRAAALTCSRRGADLPRRAELDRDPPPT